MSVCVCPQPKSTILFVLLFWASTTFPELVVDSLESYHLFFVLEFSMSLGPLGQNRVTQALGD